MSVYRRGKSWYINISFKGTRICRKVSDDYATALAIQETLRHEARSFRVYNRGGIIPFDKVAQEFLKHTKSTLSKRTYELYYGDYNVHLKSFLNLSFLSDINNELLLKFQARQKQKKLSNRTVNMHMGLIRKIMNYAIQNKYIADPELKYPMLRESKRLHAFFSPDEWDRLIEKVSYKLALKRILLGRLTGMRPKELAYLAWDDIDMEMKYIKIQSKKEWKPKTDEERIIPLSQEAIKILESIPQRSMWVFSDKKKPILDIRRALKTAARKAGITKSVSPGLLRHTFATHALMKGADIQAVQAILGHKSLETTTRYTHALKESMVRAVELLSKSSDDVAKSATSINS